MAKLEEIYLDGWMVGWSKRKEGKERRIVWDSKES